LQPEKEEVLMGDSVTGGKKHIKINIEGMQFESIEWINLGQAGVSYWPFVNMVPERAELFFF
jgi:hypothetical protein